MMGRVRAGGGLTGQGRGARGQAEGQGVPREMLYEHSIVEQALPWSRPSLGAGPPLEQALPWSRPSLGARLEQALPWRGPPLEQALPKCPAALRSLVYTSSGQRWRHVTFSRRVSPEVRAAIGRLAWERGQGGRSGGMRAGAAA